MEHHAGGPSPGLRSVLRIVPGVVRAITPSVVRSKFPDLSYEKGRVMPLFLKSKFVWVYYNLKCLGAGPGLAKSSHGGR